MVLLKSLQRLGKPLSKTTIVRHTEGPPATWHSRRETPSRLKAEWALPGFGRQKAWAPTSPPHSTRRAAAASALPLPLLTLGVSLLPALKTNDHVLTGGALLGCPLQSLALKLLSPSPTLMMTEHLQYRTSRRASEQPSVSPTARWPPGFSLTLVSPVADGSLVLALGPRGPASPSAPARGQKGLDVSLSVTSHRGDRGRL